MNSGNSAIVLRMTTVAGSLAAVGAGLGVSFLLGGVETSAGMFGGLIAMGIVFALTIGFAVVLTYFGQLRLPAVTRSRNVRESERHTSVFDADMSPALRTWIRGHELTPSARAKISRFGVTVGAGPDGLTIWAGTGFTPVEVAKIDWQTVSRLLPPDPAEYIGAETSKNAVTVVFSTNDPDLAIPMILTSSVSTPSGDYRETRDEIAKLDEIRLAALHGRSPDRSVP